MVTESIWNNLPVWVLENSNIQLVIIPSKGGKICSFVDKKKKWEWMAGPGRRPIGTVPYGAIYTKQEMCGWDDMFPTIDACEIKSNSIGNGVQLPDHGEIWVLEASIEAKTENSLQTGVDGIAFPYHFSRNATLLPNGFQLDYSVRNTGRHSFPYLWAAHPQFHVTASTKISIIPGIRSVYNVVEMPQWGAHGSIYSWPQAVRLDGQIQSINRVRSANHRECHKFYLLPDETSDWAELTDASTGCRLRIEWGLPVRYLGILVDEGKFNSESIIALEPSTGFYDDLARAIEWERASVLQPGETHSWHLKILI